MGKPPLRFTEMVGCCTTKIFPSEKPLVILVSLSVSSLCVALRWLGSVKRIRTKPVFAAPLPLNPGAVTVRLMRLSGIESSTICATFNTKLSVYSKDAPSGAESCMLMALRSS